MQPPVSALASPVDAIIFSGGGGAAPVEQAITSVRRAAAADLAALALACERIGRVVLVTSDAHLAEQAFPRQDEARLIVDLDDSRRPFHIGHRLVEVIDRYGIERPLYFGGGAAPLLTQAELMGMCDRIAHAPRVVVANNFWSVDCVGWAPGAAIQRIDLPSDHDNQLAVLLHRQAGLPRLDQPPSIGTLFDIDAPGDLLILRLHPRTGPQVRKALEALPWGQDGWNTARMERVLSPLVHRDAEICLAGRVGNSAFAGLRQDLACRLRLFAEERGMQSSGRDRRGEVRSLLGFFLEAVGTQRFFAAFAELGSQAVFLDSRVLFHHLGLKLSASDRFYSDLGCVDRITDPVAQAFTAAALAAAVPVVLGAQSIVSGGLWALSEVAWERADAGLLAALE